jgi:hypothetical protein
MIGAVLAGLFFGITLVCANRAIRLIGFVRANLLLRLLLAIAARLGRNVGLLAHEEPMQLGFALRAADADDLVTHA